MKEGTRLKYFFELIRDLGKKIDSKFLFYPETTVYNTEAKFPCVTYGIYNRKPYQGHKPRRKESFISPDDKDLTIIKYSQMFDGEIEFGIWGQSYETVDDKRDWFEKFILRYSDEFKKEGILEIFFKEQLQDQIIEIKDNSFVKQSVRYYFRNERISVFPVDNINDITTINGNYNDYQDIKG